MLKYVRPSIAAKNVEFNMAKALRLKIVSMPKNVFASTGTVRQTTVQFKNTNRPKAERIPSKAWFCHGQSSVCFQALLKLSRIPICGAIWVALSDPEPDLLDAPAATVT